MLTHRFELFQEAIRDAPVIDTGDHLRPLSQFHSPMTVTELLKLGFARAFQPAMSQADPPILRTVQEDSWEAIQPFIQKVKLTSHYHSLMRGLVELYDLNERALTPASYATLTRKLRANYQNPSWMRLVLERANIRAVLWDPFWKPGSWETPERRMAPSLRISSSLIAFHPGASDSQGGNLIRDWAPAFNLSVDCLQDLEDLIDKVLQKNVQAGARALVWPVGEARSLSPGLGLRESAQRVFGTPEESITPAQRAQFGDTILCFYLDRAREHGLVLQVHGGPARMGDSNLMALAPFIEQHPGVVFDLFHTYPWIHEAAALAYRFTNVRLNLTGLQQLSREMAVQALKEWLQVAPQTGCISWGGGCTTVEETFGALLTMKFVIAWAVTELFDDDYLSREDAMETARNLLYQNGKEIYGIPDQALQAGLL